MKTKQEVSAIITALKALYPDAQCSLDYGKDYELLFSVRLAAQCTDARVNLVTPALFARYPTLEAFAEADVDEVGHVCDTHCIRITGRLGLTDGSKDPLKVERQLRQCIPPEESNNFCHRMVLHGRAVCTARSPRCGECTLRPYCDFGQGAEN